MTKTFEYTHYKFFGWNSTLVRAAMYNDSTKQLVVELGNKYYKYHGVPLTKFEAFAGAASAGTFYNNHIKDDSAIRSQGFMGYGGEIEFCDLEVGKKVVKLTDFEVTVEVTLTTTVRVSAENFDSAASLAVNEVEKIKGTEPENVTVTGVKKL